DPGSAVADRDRLAGQGAGASLRLVLPATHVLLAPTRAVAHRSGARCRVRPAAAAVEGGHSAGGRSPHGAAAPHVRNGAAAEVEDRARLAAGANPVARPDAAAA